MLARIKGALVATLLLLNLLVLPTLVIFIALAKWLIPVKSIRRAIDHFMHEVLTSVWVSINSAILSFANKSRFDIRGNGELHQQGWYLLMSNHRSWLDILILQRVFNKKIPMLKFFMKQELLWMIPVCGLTCYLLDYPFMKRHSKAYLKKHPEQRDKDIETTRKTCERFKTQPVTMTNFVEGTRSTSAKRLARRSPYQHLLPAKAGGIAFTMATMSECLHDLIDTTIVYHRQHVNLWDYLCGIELPITVEYETMRIPDALRGDYYHDKAYRKTFQHWLNARWQAKDQRIIALLKEQA